MFLFIYVPLSIYGRIPFCYIQNQQNRDCRKHSTLNDGKHHIYLSFLLFLLRFHISNPRYPSCSCWIPFQPFIHILIILDYHSSYCCTWNRFRCSIAFPAEIAFIISSRFIGNRFHLHLWYKPIDTHQYNLHLSIASESIWKVQTDEYKEMYQIDSIMIVDSQYLVLFDLF